MTTLKAIFSVPMSINKVPLDDTDPAFKQMYYQRLSTMSAGEKIQRMSALSEMATCFVLGGIKERYPAADEQELKVRYAAIICGREFVMKHFQWDPEVEGY